MPAPDENLEEMFENHDPLRCGVARGRLSSMPLFEPWRALPVMELSVAAFGSPPFGVMGGGELERTGGVPVDGGASGADCDKDRGRVTTLVVLSLGLPWVIQETSTPCICSMLAVSPARCCPTTQPRRQEQLKEKETLQRRSALMVWSPDRQGRPQPSATQSDSLGDSGVDLERQVGW